MLYSTQQLANICAFLARADWDQRYKIADDLAIWSQANTRAYNEVKETAFTRYADRGMILDALNDPEFRYDRQRAINALRNMRLCVRTTDGKGPSTFVSFDADRYFRAYANIIDLAFARLVDEGSTE